MIDYHITLGNILTLVVSLLMFVLAVRQTIIAARQNSAAVIKAIQEANMVLDRRITVFETILADHAKTLVDHARRMDTQDQLLIKLIGDIQRLVGRIEGLQGSRAQSRATDT